MRKTLGCVLVACALAGPITANATLVSYDLTVASSNWVSSGTPPLGLSGAPTLLGSVTLDNELSGIAAFVNFSLTTGTHTWTLADYTGSSAYANFGLAGDLTQFALDRFTFGGTNMYFYSNNTMNVYSGGGQIYCNYCVSVSRSEVASVPEPSTLALFGLGLVGIAFVRRQRKPEITALAV